MTVVQESSERLGDMIRRHRSRAGVTQQQLADFSTVSVRAIRDLEQGRTRQPRRDTLRLIADALRLGADGLWDLERAAGRERAIWDALDAGFVPGSCTLTLDEFVGRDDLLALLRSRLWRHGDRVIGLTGAPGVGKSRLAAELAATAEVDGFLLLWHDGSSGRPVRPSLRHGGALGREIGYALQDLLSGATLHPRNSLARCKGLVGDLPALIVLDGIVRGPDDDALDRLLRKCPALRIVYTSTRPRGVRRERVLPVPPLDVPGHADGRRDLTDNPSVRIVLGQVPTAHVDSAVAGICQLLDGLPLALQSASSLLRIYGPGTLLRNLNEDPFRLLSVHSDPRDLALRDRLTEAVAELSTDEAALLSLMCRHEGLVSVEELSLSWGRDLTVCGLHVASLLAAGLVRAESLGHFRPLHLVRALMRTDLASARPIQGSSRSLLPVSREK